VAACSVCDNGAKLDDEYFCKVIVLSHDPTATPEGTDVTLSSLAKLRRPEKAGLAALLRSQARRTEPFLLNGYRQVGVVDADADRLRRVVERIVRGLFAHSFGVSLPPEADIRVWAASEIAEAGISSAAEPWMSLLGDVALHEIGGHAFAYRFAAVPEFPLWQVWHLRFFRLHDFFAFLFLNRFRVA
jgi:hypothetical protein